VSLEREEMIYVGDGLRAPEPGELVGREVVIDGRRGRVVENSPLFMTVEWEKSTEPSPFTHTRDCKFWLCRLIWWIFGR
jgi:hypothetical protein